MTEFGQKVLTDMLEPEVWSSGDYWHADTNKKARSKNRWLLIEECDALWVKIKTPTGHSKNSNWWVMKESEEKSKSAGRDRKASEGSKGKLAGGRRNEKPTLDLFGECKLFLFQNLIYNCKKLQKLHKKCNSPVDWSCRIHRLHLGISVLIWH